jgi:hypothetical protein
MLSDAEWRAKILATPEYRRVDAAIARYSIKSIRPVNKTGSSILVRLVLEGDPTPPFEPKLELRLPVYEIMDSRTWYDYDSKLMHAFQKHGTEELQAKLKGQVGYGHAIFEAIISNGAGKKFHDQLVDYINRGEPEKKQRAHGRKMALDIIQPALKSAFENGVTRDEIIEMMDLILVEGVMVA